MGLSRRGFLTGLGATLAAPAVVRSGVLMPLRGVVMPPRLVSLPSTMISKWVDADINPCFVVVAPWMYEDLINAQSDV